MSLGNAILLFISVLMCGYLLYALLKAEEFTVFMALCILGLDLLIYVFFHRYLWRQAQRSCPPSSRLQRAVAKPFWVVSQKAGHGYRSRLIEGSAEKRTAKRTHAASFDGPLTNSFCGQRFT
jgi:K+-transporting ATPase KdpF subunit